MVVKLWFRTNKFYYKERKLQKLHFLSCNNYLEKPSKGRYTYDVYENWPIFKTYHSPLVQLRPKFFHPLDLGRSILNELSSLSK